MSDKKTMDLLWKSELQFEVDAGEGRTLGLDGDSRKNLSPTEALLSALGGCMAIDVVIILRKMRADLRGLRVEMRGNRRSEKPRYFTSVELHFHLRGQLDGEKVERAIALSRDKYCSVLHTLRPDLELTTPYEIKA